MNHKNQQLLQSAYDELQQRVTRFSAVEQKLKDTQDQLDHELSLYKRLSHFNSTALQLNNANSINQLAVETIVDILEVEAAILCVKDCSTGSKSVHTEGIPNTDITKFEFYTVAEFVDITDNPTKVKFVDETFFSQIPELNAYAKGALLILSDEKAAIEIGLLGLISKQKAPLFRTFCSNQETIFQIFGQQFLSLSSSHIQNTKIQNQLNEINISKIELTKLSLIARNTNNNVVIANAHGEVEWVNDSFIKTTGYELDEIRGRKPKDFLKRDVQSEEEHNRLIKALQEKKNVTVELINYTKSGVPYYNHIEIIPVFDDEGNHINFISVQKDVTHEVKARNEILKINKRFETIAEKSQIGIWEWETSTQQTIWNSILEKQLGITRNILPEDFYTYWKSCLHPEDKYGVFENLHDFINSNEILLEYEYRIIRKNDFKIRYINSLVIAERNAKGEIVKLIGSNLDITEKHEAEVKVENLKQYYESLFHHSPSQKIVLDSQLNISFINNSFLKYQPEWESFIGKNMLDLTQQPMGRQQLKNLRRLVQKVSDAIDFKKLIHYSDTFFTPTDKQMYRLVNVFPYFIGNDLQYVIINAVDISELKKTQKTIVTKNQELQKLNNELDNFVYRVSHDLRGPLLSIKGLVNLILSVEELDDNLQEYIHLIDTSATRLDGTIQEILEFSRNARLEIHRETFNVREMVQSIFDDLRFTFEDHLTMTYESSCGDMIFTDKYRLSTLLKNIIGNAVKYRQTSDNESFVNFSLAETDQKYIITVEDNGEGIAEENIGKIFKMFYRGSNTGIGTGLGLYICKEIVEKLGGSLEVVSEFGKGSKFMITLSKK
ncbi:PAS domain-containing sensor histidine kinase [Flavobacterium stagni]|uniref:histidine kinase n=1 Tax=Flavobacterium stagni TaxID=2506421 RepID=A0A4Q1K8B3_9FLAO|nr:PAS domain-containing sensor histidine kinase [Flavobacterium stagni]RXR21536.1 PAS domain-containing protein [Flavobacterium stagni]